MADDATPDDAYDAAFRPPAQSTSAPATAPLPAPADDADALTRMLYGEARGESRLGQIGAAYTAVNRAKQTNGSIASIASDPGTYNGYPAGARISTSDPDYKRLHDVAEAVLQGKEPDPTGGAIHFLNPDAMNGPLPAWASGSGYRIGNHVFYGGAATGNATDDGMNGYSPTDKAQAAFNAKFGGGAQAQQSAPGKTETLTIGPTPLIINPDVSYARTPVADRASQGFTGELLDASGKRTGVKQSLSDAQEGFYNGNVKKLDSNARAGSEANPWFIGPNGNLPPRGGDWYIDRTGAKKQVVDPDPWMNTAGAAVSQLAGLPSIAEDPRLEAYKDATVNNFLANGANTIGAAGYATGAALRGRDAEQAFKQRLAQLNAEQDASRARFPGVRNLGAVTGMIADLPAFVAGGPAADAPLAARVLNSGARSAAYSGAQGFLSSRSPYMDDRLKAAGQNALIGAATGGAFEGVPGLAGKLVNSATVSPARAALAGQMINDFGVPLRAGQISDSPALRIMDSELVKSGPYAKNAAQQAQALTRAVAAQIGEDADNLTPDVMSRARSRIGQVFENVAQRSGVNADDQFLNDIARIESESKQVPGMPSLDGQIKNVLSGFDDNGQMSGAGYQSLTRKGAPLDRALNSTDSNVRFYAGQIKDALDDGLARSAAPEDVAALSQARLQWKNMRAVQSIIDGVDGDISPGKLLGAVRKSYKDMPYSGAGDMGALARGANAFMKDMPDSQTAGRLGAKQILALASVPSVAEGIGVLAHNPNLGLETVGGMAGLWAANRLAQSVAARAINNPLTRNLLLRGAEAAPPTAASVAPAQVGPLIGQAGRVLNNNVLRAALVNRLLMQPQPAPQPAQ